MREGQVRRPVPLPEPLSSHRAWIALQWFRLDAGNNCIPLFACQFS